MAKNIHGRMGFLSDNEIVCCLWYLDTKFMILVNILFWKMENMWFFTFLGCNWWKMRAAQKLFLILCQVYIYLQKIPRPIRFEEKAEVPPTPTYNIAGYTMDYLVSNGIWQHIKIGCPPDIMDNIRFSPSLNLW